MKRNRLAMPWKTRKRGFFWRKRVALDRRHLTGGASDLVFAGEGGLAHFPRKPWRAVVQQAKLKDFRFHDLRHSAASYLAMNVATLAEIAEILGHKTLAMVKRYSHLSEQHTSAVVARMNDSIFS